MATMESYEWQQRYVGDMLVYPSHPLILAVMIMDRYESLEQAAERRPGDSFGAALSDSFLPGAGCAVHAALDVLRLVRVSDGNDLSAAIRHAESYWANWESQHPSNTAKAATGRVQAQKVMPRFMELARPWAAGSGHSSDFRVQVLDLVTP